MRAIGDLASFISASRFQADLENRANASAEATTTGLANDKARHLGGATLGLSLLERKTTLLQQHLSGIAEASIFARSQQAVLENVRTKAETLQSNLALVDQIDASADLETLSNQAVGQFVDTINLLNTKAGGRYLFSGSATQTKPLPDGQTVFASLQISLSGLNSANDISNAIDTWFDTLGGGFRSSAYAGSETGFVQLPLSDERAATFGIRADDAVVRDTLKALAKVAFADNQGAGLPLSDQKQSMAAARSELWAVSASIIEEQTGLGLSEAMIADAQTRAEQSLDRLSLDRLSLIGIDQFQQASEFEAAQQQLEVLYRVAARQSRTSLAEYLR